jgi:fatty acid synthase subunit beta
LGEYSALAAVANVLSVEDLVELVFLRGITMQNAVSRDERGLSSFAMVAANPARVGSFFTVKDLHVIVDLIEKHSNKLLQVVNYNVENWQYILTGYKSNLEAMRVVLTTLKQNPEKMANLEDVVISALAQFNSPTEMYSVQQGRNTFQAIC